MDKALSSTTRLIQALGIFLSGLLLIPLLVVGYLLGVNEGLTGCTGFGCLFTALVGLVAGAIVYVLLVGLIFALLRVRMWGLWAALAVGGSLALTKLLNDSLYNPNNEVEAWAMAFVAPLLVHAVAGIAYYAWTSGLSNLRKIILSIALLVAATGLLIAFVGIYQERTKEQSSEREPSQAGNFAASNSPQPETPDCPSSEIPQIALELPPSGGFIGRTPTIKGTSPTPNSVLSVSIDGRIYLFPAERANLSVNDTVHPRTDGQGKFSFELDLSGDRVTIVSQAGNPDPTGIALGEHTFMVSTGSTQGVGSASAADSCQIKATLR